MRTMICAGSYTSEVGVTKERTPDAWQEIKAGADQLARDNNVNFDFPFTPIAPETVFLTAVTTSKSSPLPDIPPVSADLLNEMQSYSSAPTR